MPSLMTPTRRELLALLGWLPADAKNASPDASALGANTAIAGYGLIQSIRLLREIGFPVIEIHPMGVPEPTPGTFPGFEFDRISAHEKAAIRKALAGFRRVTTHLPYTGLEYFSSDASVAEAAVKRVDVALEASAYFNAAVAVFHPKPAPGHSPGQAWAVMIDRIRRWGDMAGKNGIRVALETGYPKSVTDFVRMVRKWTIRQSEPRWMSATSRSMRSLRPSARKTGPNPRRFAPTMT